MILACEILTRIHGLNGISVVQAYLPKPTRSLPNEKWAKTNRTHIFKWYTSRACQIRWDHVSMTRTTHWIGLRGSSQIRRATQIRWDLCWQSKRLGGITIALDATDVDSILVNKYLEVGSKAKWGWYRIKGGEWWIIGYNHSPTYILHHLIKNY